MTISLIQLEYLLALDAHRSFVVAAEHCHVTQPTLSMQLKKLEEQLNVLIFDRSKQPLLPTDVGKKIIEQARLALNEVQQIREIVYQSKGMVKGELHVGIIPTLSPYLLPLFIGHFVRKYPGLKVTIQDLKTEEIISRIKSDQLDAGIMVTPTHDAAITEQPMFYEEFYFYLDEELSKQKNKQLIEIDEVLEEKLWLLEEGNCFRNQTFNLCNLNQINYKDLYFKYESGNLQTIMKMVDREGGITLVPQLAATDLNEAQRKRLRFIGNGHPVREVSMVFSRKFAKEDIIQKLIAEIKTHIPKEVHDNIAANIVEIYAIK